MSSRSEIMVQRTIYQVAIVSLLSALIWVMIGIYRASLTATEIGVDKELLSPIVPTIDQKVVKQLEGRVNVTIDEKENDELAN